MLLNIDLSELRQWSRRFAEAAETEKSAPAKRMLAQRAADLAEQADRFERDQVAARKARRRRD
jgi:hypothetical protein